MLTPYFEVDYLLPRTLLASLSLQMFHEVLMNNMFPADITLAASLSHFCDFRDSQELDLLKNVLEHVASQIIGSDMDMSLSSFNSAFRTYRTATDLLNNVIQIKETKVLFLAIEIYLTSLHNFQKISDKVEKPENHNYKHDDLWREYKHCRERIVHWLENDLFDNKEFKLWNAAFQLNLPEGGIKSSFTDFLNSRFRQTVKEKISPEKLVQIYCSHADTFEETVQEILSKAVLEAIESCSSFDWRKNKDGKSNLRLSELLSKVFEKEWGSKSLDNPIQDLEHALMWEPFHIYMELFCENQEAVNLNCQRIMAKFHGITKDLIEDLLQGSICVGSLRMLMSRKKQFRKIVPVIKISKPDTILKTLDGRHLELQAFENTYEIVQEFTHLCSKCKADTEPLKYQLKTVITGDINAVSLDTLVDTSILHQQRDLESYQPIIIAFKLLSPQNMQVVPDIVNCCQGSLFMKIWKKKGKEMKKNLGRKLSINEVFNYVWHQTLLDWKILCKKFVSGDLTFTEFNKWFKTRDPDELRKELMFLDSHRNTQWIDERLYQIKNFEILENCIYGAKVIIEVINEFDLKEKHFSQIFDISRVTNVEDTSMKRLDRGLLNTCSILKEITKERADCLHELVTCKSLVQWLQKTMKGGLKELQVFVDLASISAGEGDMEIAKVNCLHSATTGYAPLIFNLGQECDTEEFLKKCQDVWNDLDSNPQLPQKLRDTSRQIRWLKSVEEFHGAAEVTTLAQAEAINKRGVYQIGNLTRIPFVENPALSDVIDLQVRHKEGRTSKKDKYYRYEQLYDIQSRLMLVAGKAEQGKDDVERFMLILDSIVRLGSIYVKLRSDGCVLFSHWRIRIVCDPDSTVCAFVLFGSEEDSQAIRTRIDEKSNDVSLVIQELARFLEQCHNKWLEYIDQTRDIYFGLTYFTVDQMVILQKELVKVGSEAVPSPLVYSLLSAVKRGCTKDDLTIAVSSAKTNAIKTVTKGTKSRHIQGGELMH
ncbi:E3 ubiquitin-protein ligase RNF213-like [Mytilus galloprovincialis]|uniref:E3 ubiquitin-protein ligase RNF213-like n=1 Tax=Mytilus galloprovincialis TaxID=29158 RepID=UPI003F7C615C